MILVKKKYLYILVFLFFLLLVFGEIKFFYTLKNVNLATNLVLKYEIESFIFASIIFILIVVFFLISFIRASENILKKLDKMITLSEYGKHDVSMQLKKMGVFGLKVNYLILNLNRLNDMKSLKISSMAGINNFLVEKSDKLIFLMNYQGDILNCSNRLLDTMKTGKKDIIDRNIGELFKTIRSEELFFLLRKDRRAIVEEDLPVEVDNNEQRRKMVFYPIVNVDNEVSHVIGIVEK